MCYGCVMLQSLWLVLYISNTRQWFVHAPRLTSVFSAAGKKIKLNAVCRYDIHTAKSTAHNSLLCTMLEAMNALQDMFISGVLL